MQLTSNESSRSSPAASVSAKRTSPSVTCAGAGRQRSAGPASHPVEPVVGEGDPVGVGLRRVVAPAPAPAGAPDLEDVGEVRLQAEVQVEGDLAGREVVDPQPLVTDAVVEDAAPEQVDAAVRQRHLPVADEVGVGQVDRQQHVVPDDGRAQRHRPLPVDAEVEPGHVAGASVVEALLLPGRRGDGTRAVEHGERVLVHQHPGELVVPFRHPGLSHATPPPRSGQGLSTSLGDRVSRS